uniref:DUF3667 domain-containing protein n=1 Tax=Gelidibacter sp. TaxID=2018083 RepID=UPI004049B00F
MNCKNCQTALSAESDFCYKCGGKVIRNRLTIRNLLNYFLETFFNYDNKFIQTIVNLIINPKEVIDGYINGTRKKYIEPLAFFAISVTISGLYLFIIKKYFPDLFDFSDAFGSDSQKEFGKKITDITTEYYSLLNFTIIPALALISRIVFFNKRYNYTEHLALFFYTMPLFSIFSTVFTLLIVLAIPTKLMSISLGLYAVFFLYHCFVFKQIFSLSFKQLVIKIILFIPVFFIFYIGFSILMVIVAFAMGYLNLQDFAPPAS